MDCSTPGFPSLHHLLEFAQTTPLSQWCHPTISSSAAPFSSCPQSFPASRSFLMSWLLASGGQSIRASASASVLPMNIHNWFFQDWLVWFPSCLRGSQESSTTPHFIYLFIFICSGFCHTLKWNSHGFTCVPHPDAPSHLPLHPLPLGFPSAPGPSACLMHPTWAGDPFHPR